MTLLKNSSIYIKVKKITNLEDSVEESIFETNLFLLKNKATYIEYAAFNGSYQIFNYLLQNTARPNNSLILYAIYGGNQFQIVIF